MYRALSICGDAIFKSAFWLFEESNSVPFLGGRLHHGNGIAVSTAVDRKIEDIGRDHLCPREFFGKPHHACVRQIHLRPVLVHPCGQRLSIRLQQRNHDQLFPRGHLQDPIHRVPKLPQLPANLGQHRFARHGRRIQCRKDAHRPGVVLISAVDESNQRPCIENVTRVAHVGLLPSLEAFFDGKIARPDDHPCQVRSKAERFCLCGLRARASFARGFTRALRFGTCQCWHIITMTSALR